MMSAKGATDQDTTLIDLLMATTKIDNPSEAIEIDLREVEIEEVEDALE
jgi:hypothetical protein